MGYWGDKDYWKTRDGTIIYPQDMEDGHLVNTINMLHKNAERLKTWYEFTVLRLQEPSGDGALMAWLAEQDALWEMSNEEWLRQQKIYQLLLKEVRKRNLMEKIKKVS